MGKGDSFFSFADMAMERSSHKHHSMSASAASLDSASANSTPAGSPASLRRNPSKYAKLWFSFSLPSSLGFFKEKSGKVCTPGPLILSLGVLFLSSRFLLFSLQQPSFSKEKSSKYAGWGPLSYIMVSFSLLRGFSFSHFQRYIAFPALKR